MKILLIKPPSNDATSYYRILPWCFIEGVTANEVHGFDWFQLLQADAVIFQRPFSPKHKEVIEYCQSCGVRVIADYDDDLFSIPKNNPAEKIYRENKETLKEILELVDSITVSTPALIKAFRHPNKTIVIPNAYHSDFFPYSGKTLERTNKILWRGSNTHGEDLKTIRDNFISVANAFPNTEKLFLGFKPDYYGHIHGKKHFYEGFHVIKYHKIIFNEAPLVTIVPLVVDAFNDSKSNCSWLEATHAGSVTIAPMGLTEFNKPGIVLYKDANDFEAKLTAVLKGEIDALEMNRLSAEYIHQNLLLKDVNKMRLSLLNKLTSCS